MLPIQIVVEADGFSAEDLLHLIKGHPGGLDGSCVWEIRKQEASQAKRRMRDAVALPSILVALLSSGSAVALITGLLRIVEGRTTPGKIVVRSASGASIEAPPNCSAEKLQELTKVLEQMDKPRIQLTL